MLLLRVERGLAVEGKGEGEGAEERHEERDALRTQHSYCDSHSDFVTLVFRIGFTWRKKPRSLNRKR